MLRIDHIQYNFANITFKIGTASKSIIFRLFRMQEILN